MVYTCGKNQGFSPSTYLNESLTNQGVEQIYQIAFTEIYFYSYIEFIQSHRPEEAIPDSYDKCEPGFLENNVSLGKNRVYFGTFR